MGAFVTGLEFSSKRRKEIVGRPAASFFDSALAELGVAPANAVLIGEDLHDDVAAARASGLAAVLVRTGKLRPGDDTNPAVRPALVTDDFGQAAARLLTVNY